MAGTTAAQWDGETSVVTRAHFQAACRCRYLIPARPSCSPARRRACGRRPWDSGARRQRRPASSATGRRYRPGNPQPRGAEPGRHAAVGGRRRRHGSTRAALRGARCSADRRRPGKGLRHAGASVRRIQHMSTRIRWYLTVATSFDYHGPDTGRLDFEHAQIPASSTTTTDHRCFKLQGLGFETARQYSPRPPSPAVELDADRGHWPPSDWVPGWSPRGRHRRRLRRVCCRGGGKTIRLRLDVLGQQRIEMRNMRCLVMEMTADLMRVAVRDAGGCASPIVPCSLSQKAVPLSWS